jgi:uncharacterized membrane protein YdjX (TVP38/TMEM64 family)
MKQLRRKPHPLRALLTAQNGIALAVLLSCISIAWWLLSRSSLDFSNPQKLIESIQALGPLGIFLYVGFLVVAIVVGPIPSTPVTIAAGAVWGPNTAGVYGVLGIYLGSLAAYFIGRTLGRSVVRVLLGKVIFLSNHRGEVYLGWLVFLTHLMPFMPYDLVSYGAGISGMSFPIYATACLLGVIPCIFFLTHVGSAFTSGLLMGIGLVVAFALMLVILPWGVKRYNWLGLRDMIRLE